MYAIVETGGKQYRVAPGDLLDVELLPAEAGNSVTLDRVLFVAQEGKATAGTPTVANASVVAEVVEHLRGPKKTVFKLKRRKGYQRKAGHRQPLTRIKISEIKV
jgi:large subunit ribosomal protein L21